MVKKDAQSAFGRDLGARIRSLRESSDLSQEELAERLGINRVALTQIENAQRQISANELMNIAQIFGVSTDVLLDLKQNVTVVLEKVKSEHKKKDVQMRISVPQQKLNKFKEVLLYILKQIGSQPNVGETVLYKHLYFIDFDFYEKYEEQLIGATYIKNIFGPTPVEFVKIIKDMIAKSEVELIKTERSGFPQKKYLPCREPDLSQLKAHEIKLIDEVIERLSNMGARQISEYSHGDIPWLTTEDQEIINYESVFYRTPQYSVREYDDADGDQV